MRLGVVRWAVCLGGVLWVFVSRPDVPVAAEPAGPFQATGFKIGEVTDRSAIVWTRLTLRETPNPSDGPRARIEYAGEDGDRRRLAVRGVFLPEGRTVDDLAEAVAGTDGDVRVRWAAEGDSAWQETPWRPVDPLADFTRQFLLEGLAPATRYRLRIEARGVGGAAGTTTEGGFRTAATADDARPVRFTAATCFGNDDQDSPRGFRIYDSMARQQPDFFVHTGDVLYYDALAKTPELARYHWQRMYGAPAAVDFHREFASYFMKDDHDTWCNDCWPTMTTPYMHRFTFRQGQAMFREQVPVGEQPYRTFRWGKLLEVWLVEGRDFRSPNDAPDGAEKTIWGAQQKQWVRQTIAASDAAVRILISPTPLVGPDRSQKADNHANAGFQHEGDELRQFLSSQKNLLVLCGDRHWQYHSVDPETGLREYGCGPASDKHAGGWEQEDYRPEIHRFLRVAGGFLSVTVEPAQNLATVAVRFHDVAGQVTFEDHPSVAP